MNDPWNVKSVRLGNQYSSCIKLHGVPLLPPVMSAECRKEMQYYKLLAKEVEKRISILKPYVESESESNCDATDAPDITESEEYTPTLQDKVGNTNDFITDTFLPSDHREKAKTPRSPMVEHDTRIELDVEIENNRSYRGTNRSPRNSPVPDEIPERDCDYKIENPLETFTDAESNKKTEDDINFNIIDRNLGELSVRDLTPLSQDGPPSLSSKSFTGSLNDIHADVSKQSQKPNLVRQRSYTVLNPSPQLIAHLEVQSLSTGVEMSSISMSESMTKLNDSARKRKSWDLETAKEKWSSMAKELKNKNIVSQENGVSNAGYAKSLGKSAPKTSPYAKSNSLSQDKRGKAVPGRTTKSETGQKPKPALGTKGRLSKENNTSSQNGSVANIPFQTPAVKKETPNKAVPLISDSEDPAARVRELYEKLQKQQLMQMTSLMEKQKREQQHLQQLFEEQNSLLFKQLKTVCPKASIEVKQAWGDLKEDNDRGPVSLSQLMTSTPENSSPSRSSSPVSTLTVTSSCISKCDNVLQKSREITNSLRKPTAKPGTTSLARQKVSPAPSRNTSRRLNYDTSSDVDPMLTDRTNDTMADLNVTLLTDYSFSNSHSRNSASLKTYATRACSPLSPRENETDDTRKRTDEAINRLEDNIQNSIRTMTVRPASYSPKRRQSIIHRQPTIKELVAATKIVACAKGYLVRRLMRTERVQATVQTIRDALLCALQLHQDREGIRGADVDLHRRLIQQITAACYSLHDTFVSSTASERCALIAADRGRRQALATKQPTPRLARRSTRDTASERCALIAADRGRRQALATKQPTPRLARRSTRDTASERCALIAADRGRRQALATKQPTPRLARRSTRDTASERCALIAADRGRRQALATKQPTPRLARRSTRDTASERCALIAADRGRRQALATKQPTPRLARRSTRDTASERCALIAADRGRRQALATKQPTPRLARRSTRDTASERCALIAADRGRRQALATKQPTPRLARRSTRDTASERCLIAADRGRRQALATKQPTPRLARRSTRDKIDCVSVRTCQTSATSVTETTFSGVSRARSSYHPRARRVPWR
ncbi:calcium-dependent calmodulin binding domain-containing protein [Phthorimaea operculella]|nr:calcium-dependent calmodulin binding domain-containing protein [Phthorimaea operculella]